MTTSSLAERLRATLRALSDDADRELIELAIGGPADAQTISASRGRLPEDFLAFLAEIDGVRVGWRSRSGLAREGCLRIPPLRDALPPHRHEFGGPTSYVMVDDLSTGYGCFYEIDPGVPIERARLVYAEIDAIACTLSPLCDTFTEYLDAGIVSSFELDWVVPLVTRALGGGAGSR